MIIFISGASGYLGSHLIKQLAKSNKVFALIREKSSKERLKSLDCEYIYTDDTKELENAFKNHKPDIVINTAALYGRKGENVSDLIEANITFPSRLLHYSKKYNIKAFVNTGTSLPDEVSLYALTKNTFVKLAKLSDCGSIQFVNISLEHFYGPEDDESKFASYVINSCVKGDELALTSGLQRRDFIYIEDVTAAYGVILKNLSELEHFETIAVGSGTAPTVKDFVELIHTCSKSKSLIKFGVVEMRENELMYSCANISRLKELGWQVIYTLESGIQKTLRGKV